MILGRIYIGPFEIIEAVGKQAYRLQLPKTLEAVHPVFHVSLLEPYHCRDGEEPPAPPPVILKESGEEYEVEEVLDERQCYGRTQYLVKWTGCPDWETSCEDESNLENATEVLEAFKSRPMLTIKPPTRGRRPQRKRQRR